MNIYVVIYPPKGEPRLTIHQYASLEGVEFHWSEGNYSCDCNRSSFYSHEVLPCNTHENLYKVEVFDNEGKLIYTDKYSWVDKSHILWWNMWWLREAVMYALREQ